MLVMTLADRPPFLTEDLLDIIYLEVINTDQQIRVMRAPKEGG